MLKAEEILQLPDHERRKLKLKKSKKSRRYNREHRPVRSREELISYLRTKDFRSSRVLTAGRHKGDPNVYDFIKEFGSWDQAKLEAFGPPPPSFNPEMDAEYMAKTVVEFELWTTQKYRAARKKNPGVIPSFHRVLQVWGRYSNLKVYCQRISAKKNIEIYRSFRRRLGRAPTAEECEKEGLDLAAARKIFGSLRRIEKFVKDLEKAGANKR